MAQDGEKLFIQVRYSVLGMEYLENNRRPYNDLFNLDVGQDCSVFYSYLQYARDSVTNSLKKQGYSGYEIIEIRKEQGLAQGGKDILITNNSKNEYLHYTIIGAQPFSTKESIEQINWKTTSDTENILQYKCFKATAKFKGREWVVWFTTDIPVKTGPWKLSGLPGLILKAYDSENNFTFECVGITKIDKKIDMSYYSKYHHAVKSEYDKMIVKSKANPLDFIENQMGIKSTQGFDRDGKPIPRSKFQNLKYNPIER
jgi:GLPGLI family protein